MTIFPGSSPAAGSKVDPICKESPNFVQIFPIFYVWKKERLKKDFGNKIAVYNAINFESETVPKKTTRKSYLPRKEAVAHYCNCKLIKVSDINHVSLFWTNFQRRLHRL